MLRARASREGFTLVELLVAALLMGGVMAMAMQGFTTAKRSADLARSRSQGSQESTQAVEEIAGILRRSAIVFYSGLPLSGTAATDPTLNTAIANSAVDGMPRITSNSAIPAIFQTTPYTGAVPTVPFNMADPTKPYSTFTPMERPKFRFQAVGDGYFRDPEQDANTKQRLHAADPNITPAWRQFFSAPLLYAAEPIFYPADTSDPATTGGKEVNGSVPIGWNFYVVYLAPMDVGNGDSALIPVTGASTAAKRDMGGDPINDAAHAWKRSTVPFELRLLTIKNVAAGVDPSDKWFSRQSYTEPSGRQAIPPVPWDYPQKLCNFDPILVSDPQASSIMTPVGYAPYNPPIANHAGSRVRWKSRDFPHTNFGALGNDPPTNDCFEDGHCFLSTAINVLVGFSFPATNTLDGNASDRVLARWIDPDNPDGTFVRFENSRTDPKGMVPQGGGAASATGPLNGQARYVDTIEGGYQYNGNAPLPTRALVSITTRYRTGRDIPFVFTTKSQDVSLEASYNYQQNTLIRLRRN